MRDLPDGMAEALIGSAGDVSMQFNIWYGGDLVYNDVPANAFGMTWDDTQQVMGQSTFGFVDPDGLLLPWGYDDPLSVGGGRVQTKFLCGPSSLDLGFQRITRSAPQETWRLYEPGGVKSWVAGTHIIQVSADDLTTMTSTDTFLAPETPPKGSTVFSEIDRVCTFADTIIDSGLTDRSVPATIVYTGNRLDTLQQLADAISAGLRVNGSGQVYVYPVNQASVFTFEGGAHDASLIGASRSADYSGLYNGVISRNTLANGTEIQAVAVQHGGPLDWDGEHGHVIYEHQASFALNQGQINADAATMLSTLQRRRASSISFTGTLHPGLETGDKITLMMPLSDGSEQPLDGILSRVSITGSAGVDATMGYTVDVLDSDIAAISDVNRKKQWLA